MDVVEPVDINEEEYESLMPEEDVSPEFFDDNLENLYGDNMYEAKTKLRSMWEERNPGAKVPQYLKTPDKLTLGDKKSLRSILRKGLLIKSGSSKEERQLLNDKFKKIFPDADLKNLQFIYVKDVLNREIIIEKLLYSKGGVEAQIVMIDGKFQERINPALLHSLGEPNLRIQSENNLDKIDSIIGTLEEEVPPSIIMIVDKLEQNFYEKDGLHQKILDLTAVGEDASIYYDRLRKLNLNNQALFSEIELSITSSEDLKDLENTIKDEDRVFKKKLAIEEKLRKRTLIVEKYRKELEKQQVAESPETKAEVDRLIDLLDEAEEKIKQRERKLGLTRKDKIRRYLIKIGVPNRGSINSYHRTYH